MSKVLALTGVTGKKSGRILAEHIANNSGTIMQMFPGGIKALVRPASNTEHLRALIPDIKLCEGNLCDKEYLIKSFADVDTVIHVATILMSKNIVDAAVEAKVRRLILVHTTGVYSKYKKAGEEYRQIDAYVTEVCKKNNIILTICRPTMIYGNKYDNNVYKFTKMVAKYKRMPIVNGAKYELQPVYYKDLGKAYFDILLNETATANKNYNLSGKNPIFLRDMLKTIGKNMGKDVKFISCPFPIAYLGSLLLFVFTFGKKDMREKVQRICETRVYSHEDATRDFGYNPRAFEDGVACEVKEFLNKR